MERSAAQAWPKPSSVLCCSGRLVLSPLGNLVLSSLSYFLYATVVIVTWGPGYSQCSAVLETPALCAAAAVLPVVALASALTVALSDPGIVARNPAVLAPGLGLATKEELAHLGQKLARLHEAAARLGRLPRVEWPEVVHWTGEGSSGAAGRFCRTCMVVKPSDVHHCSSTGDCVAGFDHYCGVLGKAIGRGNHRAFMGLISATAVGSLLLAAVYGTVAAAVITSAVSSAPPVVDPSVVARGTPAVLAWAASAFCLCFCCCTAGTTAGMSAVVALPVVVWCTLFALSAAYPGIGAAALPLVIAAPLLLLGLMLGGFTMFNLDLVCTGDSTKSRIHRRRAAEAAAGAGGSGAPAPAPDDVSPDGCVRRCFWLCVFGCPRCCGVDPCRHERDRLSQWEPRSARAFAGRGWGAGRRVDFAAPVSEAAVAAALRAAREVVEAAEADVAAAEQAAAEAGEAVPSAPGGDGPPSVARSRFEAACGAGRLPLVRRWEAAGAACDGAASLTGPGHTRPATDAAAASAAGSGLGPVAGPPASVSPRPTTWSAAAAVPSDDVTGGHDDAETDSLKRPDADASPALRAATAPLFRAARLRPGWADAPLARADEAHAGWLAYPDLVLSPLPKK